MFRPLILAALLSINAPGALAQDVANEVPTILRFNPGQSSQEIRGTIAGYQGAVYALNARSGDRADIRLDGPRNVSIYQNITSPSGRTVFNGSLSGSRFNGTLNESGVYRVRVYLMRNDARRGKRADFRLNIRLDSTVGPGGPTPRPPYGHGPSFDCRKASGTIETAICRSASLSELDARLAFVYKDALAGAPPNRRYILQNDQRNWLLTRNDCARRPNVAVCLDKAYRSRIGILEPKR